MNPQGTSFDVKTPDLQVVTINLRKPLKEPVTGVVEVHGIVQGRNSMVCDFYMVYPKELADTYGEMIFYILLIFSNIFQILCFLN